MRLLLDLGNTRLKWAMVATGGWVARGAVAWDENVPDVLAQAWRGLTHPARILGASVVDPEREMQIAALAQDTFELETSWVRTQAAACGVRIAYAEPQRLGVDRFLTMVAARAAHQTPCVLASVGTALTLDALTAEGLHLGGLIAPGPRLMQQSLLGATARVRPDQPGAIRLVADNTADAVVSGCWQATAALVERFAGNMASQLGGSPRVLLDGGDAQTLQPLLNVPVEPAPDGVLRGLLVWADSHPDLLSP